MGIFHQINANISDFEQKELEDNENWNVAQLNCTESFYPNHVNCNWSVTRYAKEIKTDILFGRWKLSYPKN